MQLTSDGKTFWRVAEELSWPEALGYCRLHHSDLADLHSMSGWSSIKALYSLTSSHEAWVGLFFDVRLGGLRWSSGSSFSASVWGSLPTFREGLCATLYSITFLPSLGAAWCTARRPFIGYYGVFRVTSWAWSSSQGRFSGANEIERVSEHGSGSRSFGAKLTDCYLNPRLLHSSLLP